MSLGITELISGIFKPATELIDNLHTSKELWIGFMNTTQSCSWDRPK